MKMIMIPEVINQAVQKHPDGYIRAIAALVENIASELNSDPHLHNELAQAVRDSIREDRGSTAGGDLIDATVIVPSRDRCREKLDAIRKIVDGWAKAGAGHPAVTLHRHQLAELLRIIDE